MSYTLTTGIPCERGKRSTLVMFHGGEGRMIPNVMLRRVDGVHAVPTWYFEKAGLRPEWKIGESNHAE